MHTEYFSVKSEIKWPLRRPRCRWKKNVKMDLKEKQGVLHSFVSGLGQVVGSCKHYCSKPSGSMKDGKSRCWILKTDATSWIYSN
jgi:hypothetical protein